MPNFIHKTDFDILLFYIHGSEKVCVSSFSHYSVLFPVSQPADFLFGMWLNVAVNSCGHVRTLHPFLLDYYSTLGYLKYAQSITAEVNN